MTGTRAKGAAAGPQRILAVCAGTDGDRATLDSALRLAARHNAELGLVSVVEPPSDAHDLAKAAGLSFDGLLDRLVETRRAAIRALLHEIGLPGDPEPRVVTGKPYVEIIRQVVSGSSDMVIKTAEPLGGARRFLFASTDQHLLRKCPCPVWLRHPDAAPTVRTVLAAVDVDLDDAWEPGTLAELNRSVMHVAAQLASEDGATIWALHAWDAQGEGLVRLWASGSDPAAVAEAYVTSVHTARARALKALATQAADAARAAGIGEPTLNPILERGAARSVIPQQVGLLKPDVLVLGTVARTGIQGVIIGNTAEDVLNSVDCSVVAVKPPGFVSPLKLSPER